MLWDELPALHLFYDFVLESVYLYVCVYIYTYVCVHVRETHRFRPELSRLPPNTGTSTGKSQAPRLLHGATRCCPCNNVVLTRSAGS